MLHVASLNYIPRISRLDYLRNLIAEHPKEFYDVLRLQKNYGNIFLSSKSFVGNIYTVCGAPEIEHVHLNEHKYIKKYTSNKLFKALLGNGMLLNSGDKYVDRRKNILPIFKVGNLKHYVNLMQQSVDDYINFLQGSLNNKNKIIIDIEQHSTKICLDIAAKIFFNKSWGDEIDSVAASLKYLNENCNPSLISFKTQYQIIKRLTFLKQVIKKRFVDVAADNTYGENTKSSFTLTSCLLNYNGKKDYNYENEREIIDEITTLLLTGHETSAISVVFALALLELDYSYKQLVLEEINQLNQDNLTYENLQQCAYTKMWLEETLRLFPPVWTTVRYTTEHDEINGYYIPARSYVISSIYALHRNPEYWNKPDVFDPFRFTKENKEKRIKSSYMPFIVGPRSCAASHFAMLELQVIVTRLLQFLRFEKTSGQKIRLAPYLTLRTDPSLSMYVSAV